MLKASFRVLTDIHKIMEKERQRTKKALGAAVKVEAYRLSNALRDDLKKGAPGGQRFAPLSEIAKRKRSSRKKIPRPFSKLHAFVKYKVEEKPNGFKGTVGLLGAPGGRKISPRFAAILAKHGHGFLTPMSKVRMSPEKAGKLGVIHLGIYKCGTKWKKRNTRWAKYTLLKKGTASFKTPARPIIEPFMKAQGFRILRNIEDNFDRKMKGERI